MKLHYPSPLERHTFRGIDFWLKRDDLIDRDFSGNKARKFAWYLQQPFPEVTELRSYGSPQSNAMYSLSLLARMRGWRFRYYVDHIAPWLRANPHGNYLAALQNGMEIVEGEMPKTYERTILTIDEGGRGPEAAYGLRMLARELSAQLPDPEIDIFLPSGTGTTAFYLQQFVPNRVVTTPCVGDTAYLHAQFRMLDPDAQRLPTVVDLEKKYHFGKLYPQFFKIWVELFEKTGVTFDLLYDPKGWLALLAHRDLLSEKICYIHQGGLLGNESMIRRYQRKRDAMDRDHSS